LIDRLLERKEFSEIWAMKWAQLLMVKSDINVSYKAAFLYSSWLTNQLAESQPIDKIVRELLASSGGVFNVPATNFYQVERDTLKVSENVAQVFMGIRTQCAQCHNHPFDRWTMQDYYGFTSFFAQVGRKTGEDYRETIVYDRAGGEVNQPSWAVDRLKWPDGIDVRYWQIGLPVQPILSSRLASPIGYGRTLWGWASLSR
jgi:hypothetical protein